MYSSPDSSPNQLALALKSVEQDWASLAVSRHFLLSRGPSENYVHINPIAEEDGCRIGFFLPREFLETTFRTAQGIWNRLSKYERECLVREVFHDHYSISQGTRSIMHQNFVDSRPMLFQHGTLKAKWKVAFNLTIQSIDQDLSNPLENHKLSHFQLGSRKVSTAKAIRRFTNIIAESNLTPYKRKALEVALGIATDAHTSQKRSSGEEYVVHPIEVAIILKKVGVKDPVLLAAGLLHDVGEDSSLFSTNPRGSNVWRQDLAVYLDRKFRPFFDNYELNRLEDLLWRLTKHEVDDDGNPLDKLQSEERQFNLIAESEDALIVKKADRLHNLITIDERPINKIRSNESETRAKILGIDMGPAPSLPHRRITSLLQGELVLVTRMHR